MNATAAAIRAGYSDKTAGSQGNRLKNEPAVADYIRELAEQAKNNSIATAEEVLAFATKVKRGELTEQRVIGIGNGAQSIENFQASLKDRLAAATLLAKFHGILEKAPEVGDIVQTVVIDGSLFDDLEDEPEAEADDVQ
jgi:phage terminase small subunit